MSSRTNRCWLIDLRCARAAAIRRARFSRTRSHCAVEALDDAVGFPVPRFRLDVDQVVGFDGGGHIPIDELTAVVVNDAWLRSGVF